VPGVHRRPRLLPEPTIARLPIYQRIADELVRRGSDTVSSDDLGRLAGVSAATVRRDLSSIGPFGTRGSGYDTAHLARRTAELLGGDSTYPTVIAGIGNLAKALINSPLFGERTAKIVALYDVDDPDRVRGAGICDGRSDSGSVVGDVAPTGVGVPS